MALMSNLNTSKTCDTFDDVRDCIYEFTTLPKEEKPPTWIFRGQEDASWNLQTILERQLHEFELPMAQAQEIEFGLLRKFRRHCANYISDVPDFGNYMEWFALMRHYGAPTRLLDCTYSFFVALFFAVERANKDNKRPGDFAIWAFNSDGLAEAACKVLKEPEKVNLIKSGPKYDPNLQFSEDFEKIFVQQEEDFVIPMNPYRFNERLVFQQGVFLCPGNVTKEFEKNLANMFESAKDLNKNVRKYVFKYKLKKEIIFHLQRMNMNRATLYPGLQGFAESLSSLLAFKNVVNVLPKDSEYVKRRYRKRWPKTQKRES